VRKPKAHAASRLWYEAAHERHRDACLTLWILRLLTLLVVLVAIEGMARVYRLFVPAPSVEYGYPSGLYAWDPHCEYHCTPGFRGVFSGSGYAGIPIEINSAGYRDAEFERERTPGTRRIALLGDSITFGAGARVEQRFSDLLRTAAASPAPRIETQNFAINSYTSYHYAQQSRFVLPEYAPDIVVVGLCVNDLEPKEESWPRKHVAAPDGSYVGEYLQPSHTRRAHWRDYSALASVLAELETRWKNRYPWRTWMKRTGRKWQDPARLAELRANLTAIRDANQQASRDLVVLVLPEAHELTDSEHYGLPRRTALALLDELGIARIDVSEDFRQHAEPSELFLEGDPVHLSSQGHARVARLLEQWLAETRRG
jgi:lysophospholipase L1-like esterase